MSILDQIVANKRIEIAQSLKNLTISDVKKKATDTRIPLNFKNALNKDRLSIIAEVKKASPSKGIIRDDFQPLEIAKLYHQNGADCISILTESKYFQGSIEFLKEIRKAVNIPLLRKDFIIDERQIRESYDMGADAILLIVSILTQQQLVTFQKRATDLGLTCLVEVHSEKELKVALACDCSLIGINNRNLKTFETNINQSIKLKSQIPAGILCVSESGIQTTQDCDTLYENGFKAVLVGETLMRKENPGLAIPELLGR
jgi:indole-3-glycerol phosphate synthase